MFITEMSTGILGLLVSTVMKKPSTVVYEGEN